jgi:hypothetical protein
MDTAVAVTVPQSTMRVDGTLECPRSKSLSGSVVSK